ncbi:hypothetical protein FQZ97_1061770 [compost metagenome]
MGFGGQVHHGVGLEAGQRRADGLAVGDIGLEELVARIGRDGSQGFEVAGIGQLVEVEHLMPGFGQQMANKSRTDEAGSAGDQDAHVPCPESYGWRIACWQRSSDASPLDG